MVEASVPIVLCHVHYALSSQASNLPSREEYEIRRAISIQQRDVPSKTVEQYSMPALKVFKTRFFGFSTRPFGGDDLQLVCILFGLLRLIQFM